MVGFSARNQHNIESKYKCGSCSLILNEPVRLDCGDRCCKSCIQLKKRGFSSVVVCPKCKRETNEDQASVDRNFIKEMQKLSVQCFQCNVTGEFRDYEAHLVREHSVLSCEFCGQRVSSTSQLNDHKVFACEESIVPCGLENLGCPSNIRRGQIKDHLLSAEHKEKMMTRKRALKQNAGTHTRNIDERQSEEVSQSMELNRGPVQTAHDDIQQVNKLIQKLRHITNILSRDVATLSMSIEEHNARIHAQDKIQEIHVSEIFGAMQNLESIQHDSISGIVTWKISNFQTKMNNAIRGHRTFLLSPSFYSHPVGYKIRAILYPNGNGTAEKTHMSLFLDLMRGPNDESLRFPFNYKVTFCLYDQTDGVQKRHIIDSFRPDALSNSFQQPRSEMNIGNGLPQFVRLSVFQELASSYILEDTIYIKILVHTENISNLFLAYSLDLNPVLSANVQQEMLKKFISHFEQHIVLLCDECYKSFILPKQVLCTHRPHTTVIIISANGDILYKQLGRFS